MAFNLKSTTPPTSKEIFVTFSNLPGPPFHNSMTKIVSKFTNKKEQLIFVVHCFLCIPTTRWQAKMDSLLYSIFATLIVTLLRMICTLNPLEKQWIWCPSFSVIRWLDYLLILGHLYQCKFAKWHKMLTKSGSNLCPNNCLRLFKYCQKGEVSPYLVTLPSFQKGSVLQLSSVSSFVIQPGAIGQIKDGVNGLCFFKSSGRDHVKIFWAQMLYIKLNYVHLLLPVQTFQQIRL